MAKSQLKAGVILNYINEGLGSLIPIFYTPVMLAILGQNEYGLYKLSSSITSYLSLLSLGIGSAVTRYLIKFKVAGDTEGEERMLGLFIKIFGLIAFATLILGSLLTLNLHLFYADSLTPNELSRMKILVFLMVCNMAINFYMSPYVSAVSSHEKFIFLQCMNILSTCIAPLLNIVMLFLGFASIGMAISSLAVSVLIQFLYLLYVRNSLKLKTRFKGAPKGILKEILVFSFWIFVANIVGQLYNATDTVMIGSVPALATAGTAIYSIGNTLNTMVFSLTIGVSSVLSPKTNRMVFEGRSNEELTQFAAQIGRIQGYIISLVVTGFIAFGQPFIYYYAGKDYGEAYWVAILMMVPNMIPLVQSVCLNVIVAQNKHRFRSLVYLGIAIANVVGTWFLMHTMGIVGAALMTGIAMIIGQGLIMNWYYWKKTGLEIPRFWKEVAKVYIIPALLCIISLIISLFVDYYCITIMLIGIIIYTILFVILTWLFIMNDYEKDLFRKPVKKIVNIFKKTKDI